MTPRVPPRPEEPSGPVTAADQARRVAFQAYLADDEVPTVVAPGTDDATTGSDVDHTPPYGDPSTVPAHWHWRFTHDRDLDRTIECALLVKELTILVAILALVLLRRMYL